MTIMITLYRPEPSNPLWCFEHYNDRSAYFQLLWLEVTVAY